MFHIMKTFVLHMLNDPWGRPGAGFLGGGVLLNILPHTTRADALFWASMISLSLGSLYYLLKMIYEFILKKK